MVLCPPEHALKALSSSLLSPFISLAPRFDRDFWLPIYQRGIKFNLLPKIWGTLYPFSELLNLLIQLPLYLQDLRDQDALYSYATCMPFYLAGGVVIDKGLLHKTQQRRLTQLALGDK